MTTSKVKKMLLTDAAIALSRSRCRPNRGPYSHLVVCVCLSLSAMRRNGNKKTNNNKRSKNNKGSPTMSRLWQLSLLWRTHLFIKRICSRKDKKKVNYFVTLIFCLFLLLFSVVGICFCFCRAYKINGISLPSCFLGYANACWQNVCAEEAHA